MYIKNGKTKPIGGTYEKKNVQYAKKNSKQQISFNLFVATNVNKKHYQILIERLMNAYHANKGGHYG